MSENHSSFANRVNHPGRPAAVAPNTLEQRDSSRAISPNRLELRADVAGRKLSGYAIVFDAWSQDLGGFIERVTPAALRRTLASGQDVRALLDHNPERLLGRTAAGTLQLKADARGLAFSLELPATSYANDVLALVRRGDVRGMSFGFFTRKDAWDYAAKPARRDLLDIDVREISITSIPAYTDTSVGASGQRGRSLDMARRRLAVARLS